MADARSNDAILVLLQVLWFILPIVVGGLIHVAVIKSGWLAALARVPLDGRLEFRRRRLLGDNKTLRGALVMIAATALASWVLAQLPMAQPPLTIAQLQSASPTLWGLLLGAGYILGELPNSFVKRQLDILPGQSASGPLGQAFWVIDQIDSAIGVVLVLAIIWRPGALFVVSLLALALIMHPLVAALMVVLGLKARVG